MRTGSLVVISVVAVDMISRLVVAALWASNVVGGDLLTLTQMSAKRGGHIAPGIGDYAYRDLGCPPNEEVVRRAAEQARAAGREIATVADTRAMLGL